MKQWLHISNAMPLESADEEKVLPVGVSAQTLLLGDRRTSDLSKPALIFPNFSFGEQVGVTL